MSRFLFANVFVTFVTFFTHDSLPPTTTKTTTTTKLLLGPLSVARGQKVLNLLDYFKKYLAVIRKKISCFQSHIPQMKTKFEIRKGQDFFTSLILFHVVFSK